VDAVLDGTPLNLINVGYGVSQSLPVFVEIVSRPKGSWFAIQQPEVHLHPRAQAALGDAIFDMAVTDVKRFLIETHSDFTIDRFRLNYRRKTRKPSSQILFFERQNKQNTVTPLAISAKGELPVDQPDGYRKFFIKEQMDLLGL
jgi:predicted ATPase